MLVRYSKHSLCCRLLCYKDQGCEVLAGYHQGGL